MSDSNIPSLTYYNEKGEKVSVSLAEIISNEDTYLTPDRKVRILKYVACQKIASYCGIQISRNPAPQLLTRPTAENRQQHIYLMCLEYKNNPTHYAFAEGEASNLNTGVLEELPEGTKKHNEWNKIDSQYKSAMAWSRAFSRALLSLVELYGVHSDVEAQAFMQSSLPPTKDVKVNYETL